jgi:hypothetical protein
MEVSGKIQGPFCGQAFEIVMHTGVSSQQFTTDCEVCCRPFEVLAECAGTGTKEAVDTRH